jgi:quinoprotein glucose dehydrogenase
MIWYQQLVHHDIWDYDMPPHPILIDINVDGKPVKAVVQLTKQAFAYVFDRTNGRPVWPWVEKPVPQTTVPGEWTAATQPFPSKPPGFDQQGVTHDDLINFTPELRAEAIKALEQYTIGPIYTPGTLVVVKARTRDDRGARPGWRRELAGWRRGSRRPDSCTSARQRHRD